MAVVDHGAFRWPAGEDAARRTRTEIVGLGVHVRPIGDPFAPFGEDIVWFPLENTAPNPRSEFTVEGPQLVRALELMSEQFGEGNVRPYVLWHSHYTLAQPTPFDIVHFPDWLVALGAIWHEPSDRVVLYNGDGLLSTEVEDSIVTQLAHSFGPTH